MRAEINGNGTRGGLFTDDAGNVIWLSDEQARSMKGLDAYMGATGHSVLEEPVTQT